MSKSLEGKFIAFEGTDGVGKSTQVNLLSERLQAMSYNILQLSTPGNQYRNNPHVKQYNQNGNGLLTPTTLAVMSASDRLMTYDTEIKPHLDEGGVVIVDRYKFSAEEYFKMRGADVPLLREIHERLPDPDYAILLTLDAVARQARIRGRATTDDWEERDMGYQEKVQENILAKWQPRYKAIDANQPIEEVSSAINSYLEV